MLCGKTFLSAPEAAERLGVTRLTVYRWLRGTRRAPGGIRIDDVIRETRTHKTYIPEFIVRRLGQALTRDRPRARQREGRSLARSAR